MTLNGTTPVPHERHERHSLRNNSVGLISGCQQLGVLGSMPRPERPSLSCRAAMDSAVTRVEISIDAEGTAVNARFQDPRNKINSCRSWLDR